MKSFLYFICFILCLTGCQSDTKVPQRPFNQKEWLEKEGKDYPNRPAMLEAVIYSDSLRTLNKSQLLETLGPPDYERENHLYYRISESRLGFWTLKTQSIVIKISNEGIVEWIKTHGG